MNSKDVKCPICGTVNRGLDLDETDGWMECERCHGVYGRAKEVNSIEMERLSLEKRKDLCEAIRRSK